MHFGMRDNAGSVHEASHEAKIELLSNLIKTALMTAKKG